jgi:hypothetical protein
MKMVTIRECPNWTGTRGLAAGLADALRKGQGVEVEVANGDRGELTVQVDGRAVARRVPFFFKPSVEKVLEAVREARPNGAGAWTLGNDLRGVSDGRRLALGIEALGRPVRWRPTAPALTIGVAPDLPT